MALYSDVRISTLHVQQFAQEILPLGNKVIKHSITYACLSVSIRNFSIPCWLSWCNISFRKDMIPNRTGERLILQFQSFLPPVRNLPLKEYQHVAHFFVQEKAFFLPPMSTSSCSAPLKFKC